MFKLFSNFLQYLESPNHPLLGPTNWSLRLAGMWTENLNYIHFFAVIIQITEFIELWFLRHDFEMALNNLSISILGVICVIKSISFVVFKKKWKSVINYISKTEKNQLTNDDDITHSIIKKYTKYARSITLFYWFLSIGTITFLSASPIIQYLSSSKYRELIKTGKAPYPEIISSWLPFDKSSGFGYCIVIIIQLLGVIFGGLTIASYDTTAVVIMIFFAGQLEILKEISKRLFDNLVDKDDRVRKFRYCHQHHKDLMRYSEIFDSALSPIMFVYVVICSFMICTTAVQLTKDGVTTAQQLWLTEYLGALITQLFFYCWHSNQVYAMSTTVSDGVYSSAWWSVDARERRNVLMLAAQLSKTVVFNAGLFTTLTVTTFVTIIKGAYSFYTLFA